MQANKTTTPATVSPKAAKPIKRGTEAKAKAGKAAKPAKAEKPQAPKAHDIATAYAGASTGFNASRSRTSVNLAIGAAYFTYRDDATLRDLIKAYAGKQFPRLNTDAGICRRLASAGVLSVTDNGQSLTVTARGLAYAKAGKALNPGDKISHGDVADIAKRA